jgi:hypothetical protein
MRVSAGSAGRSELMAKVSLAEHMQEKPADEGEGEPKPFVTISRQYGCWGFSLGLLLLEILNDQVEPGQTWKIYHKEIIDRLANETNMAKEILERQRRNKPRLLVDFFRSLSGEKVPSGTEVRNRITTIIRGLAEEGHAILIGQGSAGATSDMKGGLSVRLEAPESWRVKQIAFREGLSDTESKLRIRAMERERNYLQKIYETRFPRKPAFHLTYDCSVFSLAQIAQHVVYAMKLRGML